MTKIISTFALAVIMILATSTVSQAWFLDFEWALGQNWQPIADDVSGLNFTTTDGNEWLYADINSGMYNVQNNLGDWYGSGEWHLNDYVFAWLGPHQDAGRIDFLNKDASFFTVGYNSFFNFHVEAYDEFDNLIDVAIGPPNTKSYGGIGLDYLTVNAPSQNMAYVLLHDTGDMWLVDNMSGDASGVDETPIPEPATLLLLGTGLIAGGILRRKYYNK